MTKKYANGVCGGKKLVDVIKVNFNFPPTLSESKTGDPVPSDPSF
jgi:hypothetical protein